MSGAFPIFETRPLPRYFAVMRPTSGGSPSYQICETEILTLPYRGRELAVSVVKNAELLPETQNEFLRYDIENEEESTNYSSDIKEYRMKNAYQDDEDIRTVRYWYYPHYFFWNEYYIPILDFHKRFFLTRAFHRVTPRNVSAEQLHEDWNQKYRQKKRRCMELLPNPHRDRINSEDEEFSTSKQIPTFVINLLVKNEIERDNNCSITMSSFRTLQKIGVTPCYHLFDLNAIQRWIAEHKKCPVCRKQVQDVQEYSLAQRLN